MANRQDLSIVIKAMLQEQSKKEIRKEIDEIRKYANRNPVKINVNNNEVKKLTTNLTNTSNALKSATEHTKNFGSELVRSAGKFSIWLGLGTVIIRTLRFISDGVTSISELDKAIVNLKKVSDDLTTSNGIQKFLVEVNDLAIEVGHSTRSAIEAITEFKKLGYSLSGSKILGQQALIYSNISDQEINDSTKSIISTLKGFQLGIEDVTHVMDAYNEVGNNFSITSAGIGKSLQRSASALYTAGNTLEQSIGLIVAGNASVQNPEKVGTALKTVSMRIRGISEETGEAIPKLDGLINRITGVDIMEDTNTFKSTYDILVSIGKVWNQIKNDTDKANLLEEMFGKRQGDIGASVLNNIGDAIDSTNTAINSLGSSVREQAKYMDSIQAKTNEFSESVVKLWSNTISSETIKSVVDFGTAIVNIVDKVGLLNTAFLILLPTLLKFNKAFFTFYTMRFADNFYGIAAALVNRLIPALNLSTSAALGLAGVIQMIAPVALIGAIYGVVKAFDHFNITIEEQKEKVQELVNTIADLQTEYDKLVSSTGRTDEQEKYLKLLQAEKDAKESLLKTELDRLVLAEYFTDFTGAGESMVFVDSGKTEIEKQIKELQDLQNELSNSGDITEANNINNQIGEITLSLSESGKELYGIIQNYKELGETANPRLQELYDKIVSVTTALQENNEEADDLAENYGSIDEITNSVDSYATAMKELEEAEEKATEGASLSYDEKEKLLDTYPELEKAIYRTVDGWAMEESALDDLRKSIKETEFAQIEAEKNKSKIALQSAKDRIGIFVTEATTYSEFVGAMLDSEVDGMYDAYGMPYVGRGTEAEELEKQFNAYQDLLQAAKDAEEKINDIENGRIGGSGNSSKSSSINHNDTTQAMVDAINQQSKLDEIQNDAYERQIKIAESAKDYTKQLELQNKLLENQNLTVVDLQVANRIIHLEAEEIRKTTSYDTESWFNPDNTDTVEYLNLLNSFAGKTDDASKQAVESIKSLYDQLYTLKTAWKDNEDAINNMNDAILSTSDSMKDINEEIQALERERLEKVADVQSQIVDLYKNEKEEKLKSTQEWYDEELEELEEYYNEKREKYDEDLDEFNKTQQAKIDALNEQDEEDDFNSTLAEKQEELNEIQKQINELSLASGTGDMSAQAKEKELLEELADKQKEIDELVADRSKEIQINALEDSMDEYEDYIDDKQSALDEEYEHEKEHLERSYQRKVEKLEKEYSKEKLYSKAREELMSGEYDELLEMFMDYEREMGESWSDLGDTIEDEFLDKLREAKDLLEELDEAGVDIDFDSDSNESSDKDYGSGNASATLPDGTTVNVEIVDGKTVTKGLPVGTVIHTAGGGYEVTGVNNDGSYKSKKVYDKGGILETDSIAINKSGKPERILSPTQTKLFDSLVTGLPDLVKEMNFMNHIVSSLALPNIQPSNSNNVDININIEGNATKETVQDIQKVVRKEISTVFKGVGSVNVKKSIL